MDLLLLPTQLQWPSSRTFELGDVLENTSGMKHENDSIIAQCSVSQPSFFIIFESRAYPK